MNQEIMNQFRKEKSISDDMKFHSGGLWAEYIEWLENRISTADNSDCDSPALTNSHQNQRTRHAGQQPKKPRRN